MTYEAVAAARRAANGTKVKQQDGSRLGVYPGDTVARRHGNADQFSRWGPRSAGLQTGIARIAGETLIINREEARCFSPSAFPCPHPVTEYSRTPLTRGVRDRGRSCSLAVSSR